MEALQNPVIYLTLTVLLIVAFFQVKQAVEKFLNPPNVSDPSGNVVTVDNSGNVVKFDNSGNPIAVSSTDITNFFRRAFGGAYASLPAAAAAPAIGSSAMATGLPTTVAPAASTDISGTATTMPSTPAPSTPTPTASDLTDEAKERLSSSIISQIKDSLLAQRATTPITGAAPYENSDCLYQGQEYSSQQPSKSFDMSQYIRKDSIPCWGCTLPA